MSPQPQNSILRGMVGIAVLQKVPSQGQTGRHCLKKGRGVLNMVTFAAVSGSDLSCRNWPQAHGVFE